MNKILLTGGTGSLGHALVRELAEHEPEKIIIYSRDEYKQHLMAREFADINCLRFLLGDVRDYSRLCEALKGVDCVIHAAALKQIPALEYNPTEAIKTNIDGSANVVRACINCGVKKAILISTDKAVYPVNLYGATKMAAEKLFGAANAFNKTSFSVARYGNVLNSRGSVVELFLKLKEQEVKKFPITDLKMTRFWITLEQAALLVVTALKYDEKGTFIPLIPSMKITDLARIIEPDCELREIGIRPGEKIHERLTTGEEGKIFVYDFSNIVKSESFMYSLDSSHCEWNKYGDLELIVKNL